MIPTRQVTGAAYTPDGDPAAGATVYAQLSEYEIDGGVVVPEIVVTESDIDGLFTLELWPNERGATGSSYAVTIQHPGTASVNVRIVVPEGDGPVPLITILDLEPYPELSAAQLAVLQAQGFAVQASESAASVSITEAQIDAAILAVEQDAQVATQAAGVATQAAGTAVAVAGDLGTLAAAVEAASGSASTADTAAGAASGAASTAGAAAVTAGETLEEIQTLAAGVSKWQALTQAQYNAFTPAADVLYIIVG